PHHLRRRVAHDGLPADRRAPEVLVRGLERTRGADPSGSAGRRARVGEHVDPPEALRRRSRREAGRLHAQRAHPRRAQGKPGAHQDGLRPRQAGREARRRGAGSPGRRLHPDRAAQPEARRRAPERRVERERRPRGARQGRTRRGRRRLRLHDRCAHGQGKGRDDRHPLERTAHRRVRRRRREVVDAPEGGAVLRPEAPASVGAEQAPRRRLPRTSMRRAALAVAAFGASFVVLAFLLLPVVAVFVRVSPGTLVAQLGDGAVKDALVVSLETTAAAQALVLLLGTPTAYVLARRFRGRKALVTLVELPLVLPPAVAGLVLLAVAFVSGPLYVRAAIAAFEAVDANVVAASRTLGAGAGKTFFRVVLPLARGGLTAGAALAVARGLGEFGATIMFAGSLRGVTQTLSLAVYSQFDVNFD